MSARFPRWPLLFVTALSAQAALGADPLPAGAISRFGSIGGYRTHPDFVVTITPEGDSLAEDAKRVHHVFSHDGKLRADFSDQHTVRLSGGDGDRELRQLKGHTAYVAAAAFSPDGRVVASGSNDRTLRLWDTASGKELHCCRGHDDQVCSVAFAPDGKTVASASWDGSVRLWDVASGKELRRLEGHRFEARGVSFAPDGKSLASCGTDGTVRIWDPATGKELRRWTAQESGVLGLAFDKTGKQIITLDMLLQRAKWDAATGKEIERTTKDDKKDLQSDTIPCAAIAPDGKTVALGHEDGTVRLYDPTSGKELRVVGRHPGIVWGVEFSPDGKTLASCARRHGVVRLWDVATGKMVRSYPGHGGGVSGVLFTRDGKQLVAAGGSFDPRIIVYDTATAKELRRLEGHTNFVESIALAPDDKALASAAWDKTVRLWDLATGKERRHWAGADSSGHRVGFSPDGSRLLAADEAGNPCCYDVATGKARGGVTGVSGWLGRSADGRTLACRTAGSGHGIALVEVATGQERRRFGGDPAYSWATFSPDGRRLLTDQADGTVLLWDLTGGAGEGLTPRERDDCWRDLAADGSASYAAVWKLALSPKQSVPLLREKIRPAKAVDATNVPRWVADLDDDDFAVREKATKSLRGVGEAARPALEKALAHSPSAEVRSRAGSLLAKLDDEVPGAEELRELRGLEALEAIGTAEARGVIEGLAKGPPGTRLTREAKAALERLGGKR
jgi:WD40 repeat protein